MIVFWRLRDSRKPGIGEGGLHLEGLRQEPQGRGLENASSLLLSLTVPPPAVPPTISVPKGRAVVTVREGSPAELQCEVRGKPRPPVLWSRVDKEAALLPSGLPLEETPDGKLRLERVSRDMSGTYRCQTARYNGFNVRAREAQVQLNVQCECHLPASASRPGPVTPPSPSSQPAPPPTAELCAVRHGGAGGGELSPLPHFHYQVPPTFIFRDLVNKEIT